MLLCSCFSLHWSELNADVFGHLAGPSEFTFVAVAERGEDGISDRICRRRNGKQQTTKQQGVEGKVPEPEARWIRNEAQHTHASNPATLTERKTKTEPTQNVRAPPLRHNAERKYAEVLQYIVGEQRKVPALVLLIVTSPARLVSMSLVGAYYRVAIVEEVIFRCHAKKTCPWLLGS